MTVFELFTMTSIKKAHFEFSKHYWKHDGAVTTILDFQEVAITSKRSFNKWTKVKGQVLWMLTPRIETLIDSIFWVNQDSQVPLLE